MQHLACARVKVKNPAPDVWTAGGARLARDRGGHRRLWVAGD